MQFQISFISAVKSNPSQIGTGIPACRIAANIHAGQFPAASRSSGIAASKVPVLSQKCPLPGNSLLINVSLAGSSIFNSATVLDLNVESRPSAIVLILQTRHSRLGLSVQCFSCRDIAAADNPALLQKSHQYRLTVLVLISRHRVEQRELAGGHGIFYTFHLRISEPTPEPSFRRW